MAEGLELARPEVRGGAGLHADQAGRQRGEVGDDLGASQAALDDDVAGFVHTVNLEDLLGQIEADGCDRHGGWLPLGGFDDPQLGTASPGGGHPPHQIQALDRTQPELPLRAGRPRRLTATYKRHGTTCLLAALSIATGTVEARCLDRATHQEFLAFLKTLYRKHPHCELHIVLDNLSVHKHATVLAWAERRRRLHLHFTPTYASWLNQIEIWFRILTRAVVKDGVWRSKAELVAQIMAYIQAYNATQAHPFRWTYTGQPLAT